MCPETPQPRSLPRSGGRLLLPHTLWVKTLRRRPWRSAAVILGCVLAGAGCAVDSDHYSSPDNQRAVVIEVGNSAIDTVWTVSVEERAMLGDGHVIGCFTDDDPESTTPTGVLWTNSNEFVIETTDDDLDVRVRINPDGAAAQVTQTAEDFLVPCPFS